MESYAHPAGHEGACEWNCLHEASGRQVYLYFNIFLLTTLGVHYLLSSRYLSNESLGGDGNVVDWWLLTPNLVSGNYKLATISQRQYRKA